LANAGWNELLLDVSMLKFEKSTFLINRYRLSIDTGRPISIFIMKMPWLYFSARAGWNDLLRDARTLKLKKIHIF
jgi:hypothetical protein